MSHLQSDIAFKPSQQQSQPRDKRLVSAVERALIETHVTGLNRDVCRLIIDYIGTAAIYFTALERYDLISGRKPSSVIHIKRWHPESERVESIAELAGPIATVSSDVRLFAMNDML